MIKGKYISFGREVYPGATNGGERLGVSPWMRCVVCGLPNDVRKTGWSDQSDAEGGCRHCRSMRWLDSAPPKLGDDRFIPAERVRNRRRRG